MAVNNDSKIRLIVGLGNPGSEYAETRHNVGFMVVDALVSKLKGEFLAYSKYESSILSGNSRSSKIWLQKPTTFMNLSGKAVRKLMTAEGIEPEELLVIYDDLDIQFGKIRLRHNGSSGGHRGMESIIEEIGSTKFNRLRVGIGQVNKSKVIDHVLGSFDAEEKAQLPEIIEVTAEAVKLALFRGVSTAMNRYNSWSLQLEEENKVDNESTPKTQTLGV